MARKLQLRRGTAAQWAAANPVLAQGEPGFEYDTGKLKYGDGATAWNSLTYAGGSGNSIVALSSLTPANNQMSVFTGASTAALVPTTSYGRGLLNVADEAALKALVNAEAGVDFATPAALTSGLAGKQDLNSRLTGISNMASLAIGDLVQWDGSNFVRLAPGTSGDFLKSNGAGVAPSYVDASVLRKRSSITRLGADIGASTAEETITSLAFNCSRSNGRVFVIGHVDAYTAGTAGGASDSNGMTLRFKIDGVTNTSLAFWHARPDPANDRLVYNMPYMFEHAPGVTSSKTYSITCDSIYSTVYIKNVSWMVIEELGPNQ